MIISPGFTNVSTTGSRDPWSNKLLRHLIPGRAGPTTNGRFTRRRETTYLCQRVSLAVQRYNSVAFKGTFTVPTELH